MWKVFYIFQPDLLAWLFLLAGLFVLLGLLHAAPGFRRAEPVEWAFSLSNSRIGFSSIIHNQEYF